MTAQASPPTAPDVRQFVAAFRRQGWCVLEDVVPADDAIAIRAIVLEEERRQAPQQQGWVRTSIGSADAARNRKLSKAHTIMPKLGQRASFLLETRYQAVLRSLLGDYLRVSSDFGIVTFPGNEREFWHADWPYNQTVAAHIPEPYGTTLMHVGSLLMLTDFTCENGGTLVLPGSHLAERNPTALRDEGAAGAQHSREVQISGRAGSVLIYDARLWHSVAENRTDSPRVALAVRFAPWWLNLEVRRPGSLQAKRVESAAAGRPTPVPLLARHEYEALPREVRPLYEHWVDEDVGPAFGRGRAAGEARGALEAGPDPCDDALLFDLRQLRYALPMTQLAAELGLFDFLAAKSADVAEVARFLDCSERAAEVMLSVETSLGLLIVQDEGRYGLGDQARTYLVSGSPFHRPSLLARSDPLFERVAASFRRGHDATSPLAGDVDGLTEGEVRDFVDRMDALARPAAVTLARSRVWSRTRRLLDVAGGAGAFCTALAEHWPEVRCTLLERAPVAAIATRRIAQRQLCDRIAVVGGNMLTEELPRGHDAVLFSNVFHNWDPATNLSLARKAFAALEPGGIILLHEVLLNADKAGPLGAACFSVAMLLSHSGRQYTFNELGTILREAGFEGARREPALGRYHLVWATKPVHA